MSKNTDDVIFRIECVQLDVEEFDGCGAVVEIKVIKEGEKGTVPHIEYCPVCGKKLFDF